MFCNNLLTPMVLREFFKQKFYGWLDAIFDACPFFTHSLLNGKGFQHLITVVKVVL